VLLKGAYTNLQLVKGGKKRILRSSLQLETKLEITGREKYWKVGDNINPALLVTLGTRQLF